MIGVEATHAWAIGLEHRRKPVAWARSIHQTNRWFDRSRYIVLVGFRRDYCRTWADAAGHHLTNRDSEKSVMGTCPGGVAPFEGRSPLRGA